MVLGQPVVVECYPENLSLKLGATPRGKSSCFSFLRAHIPRIIISFASVILPLKRLKIADIIISSQNNRLYMINLPSSAIIFINSILTALYPGTAAIFSFLGRINAGYCHPLVPNHLNNLHTERITINIGPRFSGHLH